MSLLVDAEVPEEIAQWYRPGADEYWCTDWEGKHRLLGALGIACNHSDDEARCYSERFFLDLMRCLPDAQRFVVEARTGLWWGEAAPSDWGAISRAIDVPQVDARFLWDRAIAALWPRLHDGHQKPPGKARRVMRALSGTPRRAAAPQRRRSIPPGERFRIFKRDGYRCRMCGRSAGDGVELHIDHIVAVARGGTNERTNLQTLCRDCNLGKRDHEL